MGEMLHQVTIEAPPEKVYAALTTTEGLKGWWTADVEAAPAVGGLTVLGFNGRATVLNMRTEELTESASVRWICESEAAGWNGTRLQFNLGPRDSARRTVVDFTLSGWRGTEEGYRVANTHWGHLMVRLKQYAEGESPGPFFTG